MNFFINIDVTTILITTYTILHPWNDKNIVTYGHQEKNSFSTSHFFQMPLLHYAAWFLCLNVPYKSYIPYNHQINILSNVTVRIWVGNKSSVFLIMYQYFHYSNIPSLLQFDFILSLAISFLSTYFHRYFSHPNSALMCYPISLNTTQKSQKTLLFS